MNERQLSGRKGGLKTSKIYGTEHMKRISSSGGQFRKPNLEELRRMAEIKNNKNKGGKSNDDCIATITMPDGNVIQLSRSGNMVKTVGLLASV